MNKFSNINELIEATRDKGVDFGNKENAPPPELIIMAEQRLSFTLPPTYKWFLSNYGGGEVFGEEIFSIYGPDFESAFGGDIVFQYLMHQKSKTLASDEIPVAVNDTGEIFFMKAVPDDEGEYQVWVKRGNVSLPYAPTFLDFLEKRIRCDG